MLRHACGCALANKGLDTRTPQAYLGHRSINSTTRCAALAPGRFNWPEQRLTLRQGALLSATAPNADWQGEHRFAIYPLDMAVMRPST
jgi:hypothetical protein